MVFQRIQTQSSRSRVLCMPWRETCAVEEGQGLKLQTHIYGGGGWGEYGRLLPRLLGVHVHAQRMISALVIGYCINLGIFAVK